nr:hypothetical protein [Tanacetum cinerariifolium]
MSDDAATEAESPPRGVDSYYRPGNFEDPSPIVYPAVPNGVVSNFKIQPNLIAILPVFRGHEEPYAHLREFFSIADTYQVNNTTKDGVRLRLFPFSLKDQAKAWFTSLEPGSIHSWSEMQYAFLDEFYSISKTAAIRNKIKSFRQILGEQFHEAFSRLKELLRTCLTMMFQNGILSKSSMMANLERQIGQLAEEVHTREAGKLPSYPYLNPKHKPGVPEHVNMVASLRNGKTYNNDIKILSVHDFSHDVEDFITDDEIIVEGKKADNVKSDSELVNDLLKDFPKPPTQNSKATESPKVGEGGVSSTTTPYPEALEKSASARLAKKGPHSEDMWETFKQVKINLPFIDAIKKIPSYAKFLKDLSGRSTKIPRGILEDVIVKVDDFYYPVDFFVMDTDENELFYGMTFHENEKEFQMIEEEFLLSLEETPLQSQQVQQPTLNEVQEYFDCLLVHQDVLLRARGSNKGNGYVRKRSRKKMVHIRLRRKHRRIRVKI